MYSDIRERILLEANYVLDTGATVRKAAEKFGVSKSTVHKDVSVKLYYIDHNLYIKVRKILNYNLAFRHIRGGIATKNKYLKNKNLPKEK